MKNWLKRRWFYNFTPLGRKIIKDFRRLCKNDPCGVNNLSVDPKRYITFRVIQWSIAHRINIGESTDEQANFKFLKYVRYPYYINNPAVSAE